LSLSSQKYGFGIRNPEKTYSGSQIHQIQWSKRHWIPDPRSRIRNTDSCVRNEEAKRLRAGDLLEALTLKSADELFDMEKLEIVGDVFLKYRCNCLCWFLFIC
jgi:hypothetical protein